MNTQISYMYRDASNYKQHEDLILEGELTNAQKSDIINKLDCGEHFIPSQVGLPNLQTRNGGINSDDHVWHELDFSDITSVDAKANHKLTADQLHKNFLDVQDWKISLAMREMGLL